MWSRDWGRWLGRLGVCGALAVLWHGGAGAGTVPCDSSAFPSCVGGLCPTGQVCRTTGVTCECVPGGCCLQMIKLETCFQRTEAECATSGGDFTPNAFCSFGSCVLLPSPTPTNTPTVTPTVTPTNTRVPNGGSCMTSSECASLLCVNGVCVAAPSPAPAVSPNGLAIALATLIGLGALALWRTRRVGH